MRYLNPGDKPRINSTGVNSAGMTNISDGGWVVSAVYTPGCKCVLYV